MAAERQNKQGSGANCAVNGCSWNQRKLKSSLNLPTPAPQSEISSPDFWMKVKRPTGGILCSVKTHLFINVRLFTLLLFLLLGGGRCCAVSSFSQCNRHRLRMCSGVGERYSGERFLPRCGGFWFLSQCLPLFSFIILSPPPLFLLVLWYFSGICLRRSVCVCVCVCV